MKTLIKAFVLLLLFNGLLVYVHYQDASDVSAGNSGQSSYDQEIEVTHRADGLYIRHYFTNLPMNRLEINWPKESEQRTCHVEDTGSCLRLNEEATAFVEGEETAQAISYVIPHSELEENTELLQAVFVKLYEASPRATVLHMTDEVHLDGMWVTGLPQVGQKKLPLISYALYSGGGIVEDLYWQKHPKPIHYSSDQLTVYGDGKTIYSEQVEEVLRQLNAPHMSLILNEQDRSIVKNRFSVTTEGQVNTVLQRYAINQYYVNYNADEPDSFTAELVTALLLEELLPIPTVEMAMAELGNALTPTEMEALKNALEEQYGESMNAEVLDGLIGEVTGYRTSFVERNRQLESGVFPFLLENPKEISVEGQGATGKYAVLKDGKTYYPIKEIMEALDYALSRNEQSLYIENAEHQYRFPVTGDFYVLNDRRFNNQFMPFQLIEGEFYFDQSAMQRIFHLILEEKTDEINIKMIGMQEKDVE